MPYRFRFLSHSQLITILLWTVSLLGWGMQRKICASKETPPEAALKSEEVARASSC